MFNAFTGLSIRYKPFHNQLRKAAFPEFMRRLLERTLEKMTRPVRSPLPHHRLQVFHIARELLICVRDAQIRDPSSATKQREPPKEPGLNIAEGAARVTRADKARAYAIARGEAAEVGAAIEIAVLVGAATAEDEAKIVTLASRVVAMLTRLIK